MSESTGQFNAHADKYATSEIHRSGASLPVLLEYAAPQPQDIVLDVATGTGNTALAFAPYVARVTGIDLAENMLAYAQAAAAEQGHGNANFVPGSAEQLPFGEASFTLVSSRHAPHHFRGLDQFLSGAWRVLKPGGRLVIADQISPSAEIQPWLDRFQTIRDPSHFTQRTVQAWQNLAKRAGFSWARQTLVPYRMDFDWWTQQSGTLLEDRARLRQEAAHLSPAEHQMIGAEFNETGQLVAHTEQIMVIKLVKPAE